jgi:hypothetical protein
MDNFTELKRAILDMVKDRLAVTEMELNKEFTFTEDLKEVADIKAACIKLEEAGLVGILTDNRGGWIVLDINNNAFH